MSRRNRSERGNNNVVRRYCGVSREVVGPGGEDFTGNFLRNFEESPSSARVLTLIHPHTTWRNSHTRPNPRKEMLQGCQKRGLIHGFHCHKVYCRALCAMTGIPTTRELAMQCCTYCSELHSSACHCDFAAWACFGSFFSSSPRFETFLCVALAFPRLISLSRFAGIVFVVKSDSRVAAINGFLCH